MPVTAADQALITEFSVLSQQHDERDIRLKSLEEKLEAYGEVREEMELGDEDEQVLYVYFYLFYFCHNTHRYISYTNLLLLFTTIRCALFAYIKIQIPVMFYASAPRESTRAGFWCRKYN